VDQSVVVNATSIGRNLTGIGVYGVHLLKALASTETALWFTVVLNQSARPHFADVDFPSNFTLKWVDLGLSPDRGSRGNFERWLYANALSVRHRASLVFGTSQLEASLIGASRVVTVHDAIPLLTRSHHPRQYHFYKRVLGPALRRAAAVIVPSRATRASLEEHYGLGSEKIRVIPHGVAVPVRKEAPDPRSASPFVLCLGRVSALKNVDALVSAFQLVAGDVPERLVIAGRRDSGQDDGPRPSTDGRVVFLGGVGEAEKLDLLDCASVLVCPTLHEGFGFIPLEAMARGCPVIVSRVGSLPEVCGDAAWYVDPRDPSDIAAAIRRVLTDEPLRRRQIERGLQRVKAFSWATSAREHVRVFEAVLGAPRRRYAATAAL